MVLPVPEKLCSVDVAKTFLQKKDTIRYAALIDRYSSPSELIKYSFDDSGKIVKAYGENAELDKSFALNLFVSPHSNSIISLLPSRKYATFSFNEWIRERYQNSSKELVAVNVLIVDEKAWDDDKELKQILTTLSKDKISAISKELKRTGYTRHKLSKLLNFVKEETLIYKPDDRDWVRNSTANSSYHFYSFDSFDATEDADVTSFWKRGAVYSHEGEEVLEITLGSEKPQTIFIQRNDNFSGDYYFWNPLNNEIFIFYFEKINMNRTGDDLPQLGAMSRAIIQEIGKDKEACPETEKARSLAGL